MNPRGEVKKPQVWFYSGTATYPGLLQRYISRLSDAGKISGPWEIAVCPHQPETTATLFMLRPGHGPDFRLGPLQEDLRRIGGHLIGETRKLAKELLHRLPP